MFIRKSKVKKAIDNLKIKSEELSIQSKNFKSHNLTERSHFYVENLKIEFAISVLEKLIK